MKRLHTYLTDEQHEYLVALSGSTGKTIADYVRMAIDRMKAQTVYVDDTIEMAEEVHPEFTYEQFQAWLLFRWRLRHEGKEHNGNNAEILAKVDEILELLRRNDAPNY
jgi:hypothetical protein